MPFKPGHIKVGGRKKGSVSKKFEALRACEETGCDPFVILAKLAMGSDRHLAATCAKELAKYLCPQLKAIEMSGNIQMKPSVLVKRDGTEVHFTMSERDSE